MKDSVRSGLVSRKYWVSYWEDANTRWFDAPVVGAEVFKSSDGGTSWTKTHKGFIDDLYYSYGYYFGHIHVAPKDPNNSTVYHLYNLIASSEKSSKMAENLKAGGYGWGHAKKELIEELVKSFAPQREKFNHYIKHPQEVEDILQKGALKAKKVADTTLNRVRESLGYNS